jgi:general secretion pathway protein G
MPKLVASIWYQVSSQKTSNQKPITRNQLGFTMVELLVVITIIGVLTAAAASTYSTIQAKARDTRRRADIDEIRKAMELYYVGGTSTPYKAPIDTMFDSGIIPKDPKPTGKYNFRSTNPDYDGGLPSSGSFGNYIVCAKLEKKGGNASDILGSPISNGEYYCRKNAQ